MPEQLSLRCGRAVWIKGFHCWDTIEFLETAGVITFAGSHTRWKQYIIEKAPTRMDVIWGKRKTVFVHDAEAEAPYLMQRPDYLPPWLINVWLRCDESTRADPDYRSQLALCFFRYDCTPPIEEIVRDAIRALDWNAVAEDIPVHRWPWLDDNWQPDD